VLKTPFSYDAQKRPKFRLKLLDPYNYPPAPQKRAYGLANGLKSNFMILGYSPHLSRVPLPPDARARNGCWDGHQNFSNPPTQDRPKSATQNFSRPRFWNPIFRLAEFSPDRNFKSVVFPPQRVRVYALNSFKQFQSSINCFIKVTFRCTYPRKLG